MRLVRRLCWVRRLARLRLWLVGLLLMSSSLSWCFRCSFRFRLRVSSLVFDCCRGVVSVVLLASSVCLVCMKAKDLCGHLVRLALFCLAVGYYASDCGGFGCAGASVWLASSDLSGLGFVGWHVGYSGVLRGVGGCDDY